MKSQLPILPLPTTLIIISRKSCLGADCVYIDEAFFHSIHTQRSRSALILLLVAPVMCYWRVNQWFMSFPSTIRIAAHGNHSVCIRTV